MATASTGRGREGHLERTADEPRDEELYEVRLGRVEQVNERVRLFRLELVSGPVKFLPGQWLDTYMPDVSKAGGFTITSAPSAALTGPSPYLELAVQESPENEPAAWLWRPVGEILGKTLRVRVGGRFVFPLSGESDDDGDGDGDGSGDVASASAASAPKKMVLVAGGVGVNPLMSMLSFMAEGKGKDAVDVSFLYASKLPQSGSLSDILFLDRITRIFGQGRVKGEVKLYVTAAGNTLSQETRDVNGAQAEIHPRRLGVADVKAAIGAEDREGTMVYVCGPRTMTDELVEQLAAIIDSRRVLTERWW
ncbi:hypothetical protein V8C37DRAFT_375193 [Trichoderma ceciliae]